MKALNFFRFRNWRAQADGKIVGEMVAANGYGTGMSHDASAVDDQLRSAAADVEQAAAEIPLVLCQSRLPRKPEVPEQYR